MDVRMVLQRSGQGVQDGQHGDLPSKVASTLRQLLQRLGRRLHQSRVEAVRSLANRTPQRVLPVSLHEPI